MNIRRTTELRLCLLIIVISISGTLNSGPENTVGLTGSEIVLECNTDGTNDIAWSYISPGGKDEASIPGRYRKETPNIGIHRLILEDLKFADAGTYACRATSESLKRSAYVLVAQRPLCTSSLTTNETTEGDKAKLTCWVAFAGMPEINLSLMWVRPNGSSVKTANWEGTPGVSAHGVSVDVHLEHPFLFPHTCRAQFSVMTEDAAAADNIPLFNFGFCRAPDSQVAVKSTDSKVPEFSKHDFVKSSTTSFVSKDRSDSTLGLEKMLNYQIAIIVTSSMSMMIILVSVILFSTTNKKSKSAGCLSYSMNSHCLELSKRKKQLKPVEADFGKSRESLEAPAGQDTSEIVEIHVLLHNNDSTGSREVSSHGHGEEQG